MFDAASVHSSPRAVHGDGCRDEYVGVDAAYGAGTEHFRLMCHSPPSTRRCKNAGISREPCVTATISTGLRCAVNDQIRADPPEKQRQWRQIRARVAHPRALPQGFKRIKQSGYLAIRRVNVVLRDIFPDLIQVRLRAAAKNIAAHAPGFRRASDLRLSLPRASSGSTRSPRSSASSRRPSS